MTIPATSRKAGPLLGDGANTSFPFTFKVFAEADVAVSITDANDVITVLVLDSDYSVALNGNQETSPGGTVTYPISGAELPVGSALAIVGDLDYDQSLDLPSGGNFSPEALENQLDRATMQIQQLKELSDRSARMSVFSSPADVEALTSSIITLAAIDTEIVAVADNEANVNLVAGSIASVNTVAGNIANVVAAGANTANINAVVANEADIDTVAANIADVNTVAGSIGAVNSVADNLSVWRDAVAADDVQVTNFSGTGAQTAFALPYSPGVENNTQVFISGVYQQKTEYTVSGTTLTFGAAPPIGVSNIEVVWSRPFVLGATDAGLVAYQPDGGAVTTVQDHLRDLQAWTINVMGAPFYAAGDGVTDDTAAINSAITLLSNAGGGEVIVPAGFTFIVTANAVTGISAGVAGIVMKSNVSLVINGKIKAKDGTTGVGTYFGVIRNLDTGINNATISGSGFIDGNRANQVASVQCSNILLLNVGDNVTVKDVRLINANGNGALCTGAIGTPMTDFAYLNLKVFNCTSIGLQASQFNGLVISGNRVNTTTDNGIDIYGENGTPTPSGTNFSVTGNTVRNSDSVGIFCETVKDGVVSGNTVSNALVAGLAVNRINGEPRAIEISGNTFVDGALGARITGDMGGIDIFGNTFSQFTSAGVQIGDAAGNASYVDVSNNQFLPANNTIPPIKITAVVAAFITGKNNTVVSAGISASLLPFNIAGTSNAVNIDSFIVLPAQVGYAETLRSPLLKQADLLGTRVANTAGPVDVATTANTAGIIYVTARQGGVGNSLSEIPYVNYAGTLTIGTVRSTVQTGNPITGVTVSGSNVRLTLYAGSTYVNYFVQRTELAG